MTDDTKSPTPAIPEARPRLTKPMTDEEIRFWIGACNHDPARDALRELLAYRAATPAPTDNGAGVRVIRLNWHQDEEDSFIAGAGLNYYQLRYIGGLWAPHRGTTPIGRNSHDDSLQGAMDFAQADFEDRIRSALVPATSASLPTHWLNGAGQYITAEEKAAEPSPSYENEGQTGYLSRFSIPVFTEAATSVAEPSEDIIRAIADELIAHGEFSTLGEGDNWRNARLAAIAILALPALASRTPPVHPAPVGEAASRVITRARSVIGGLPEQLPSITALMKLDAAIADFDAAPTPVDEHDKVLEEAAQWHESQIQEESNEASIRHDNRLHRRCAAALRALKNQREG